MSKNEDYLIMNLNFQKDPFTKYRISNSQFPDNLSYLECLMNKLVDIVKERDRLSIDAIIPKFKIQIHPMAYQKIKDNTSENQIEKMFEILDNLANYLRTMQIVFFSIDNSNFVKLCWDVRKELRKLIRAIADAFIQ